MSDCGVCISGSAIGGYVQMYNCEFVKARKEHRCVECERIIVRRTDYQRITFLWEGAFETHHTCSDCAEIREAFDCSESDEAIQFGELWGSMREAFPQMTTGCLQKLETASAKAYLMECWRDWKGLNANESI